MSINNPFANLITERFKRTHKNMIDSLIDGCGVTCRITFSATKFNECDNCSYDVIGGKSSNRYRSGGPVPFYHGVCPVCNGSGKIQNIETENVVLAPIWDSKQWMNLQQNKVNTAEIDVQTLSKIDTYSKLMRATSLVIDTAIENYGVPQFIRVGNPEPCGFGSTHIVTNWRRS